MINPRTTFSALLLVTASLLSACGSVTSREHRHQSLPSNFKYLHTLSIASNVSQEDLQQRYGGYIVAYHPEEGSAVIATNSASLTSPSSLGVLDIAAEANTNDYDIMEQGMGIWSTGFGAWSTGFGAHRVRAWSTGTVNANVAATTFKDNLASWNAIKLSQAQSLVPELGKGVKVAVLDSGIELAHPAFKGKVDRLHDKDFIGGSMTANEVNTGKGGKNSHGYGHGTAVASIILQVAPNATILPVRVLDSEGVGDTATIITAIDYAVDQGAKIINLSLGSPSHSSALDRAVRDAVRAGVIVVCASGNTGDTKVIYPAANADRTGTAQGRGSVSVGSVNSKLLKSSFSTYGDQLELTAPGEKLTTAFPGGQYSKVTGTSFAAPVVSGVLALALSTGVTTLNTSQVAAMMTNLDTTATAPSDPKYLTGLGHGTIDAYAFIHKYR